MTEQGRGVGVEPMSLPHRRRGDPRLGEAVGARALSSPQPDTCRGRGRPARPVVDALPRTASIRNVIFEARGLSARAGARTLFDELDLVLRARERLVIVGPSGAGKTRLLRQLAWLDPLPSGEVSLDGRRPQEWGPPQWRLRVAYLPQAPPELPGTPAALERRASRLRARRPRCEGAARARAERFGVEDAAWSRPFSALSVGERQRLFLAILLDAGPDVLLLDEPTSALDPASTRAVEEELDGRTTLWVTHSRAQARRLDAPVLELSS